MTKVIDGLFEIEIEKNYTNYWKRYLSFLKQTRTNY